MSIAYLEKIKSEKEKMKSEKQDIAVRVFEDIERNLFNDMARIEIADALVYPVYRVLPKSIKLLIKIKQHLNSVYKNGVNVFISVSDDSLHVETSISTLDVYISREGIAMVFERLKRNERNEIVIELKKENINEIFKVLVDEILDFKTQSIPYKLIRMIVEASYKHKSIKIVDIRTT